MIRTIDALSPEPRCHSLQASAAGLIRRLAALPVLLALAIATPTAGAIVGGTADTDDSFAAPLAYIEITEPGGIGSCTGTLIAPSVVMTAAHCVYGTTRRGNLVGVSRPSEISVRVGSRNVSDPGLGIKTRVVAVLAQPYYRWDGRRHNHDVALLALDRAVPQTPAVLAEQRPDAGKSLLIAGYGATSTNDNSRPAALKAALIDAADPGSCTLVSESFDPSWLFCGEASTDPAVPGGTSCYGDSGGPAFAYENTFANIVVEGVISYGSDEECERSRSYLVLVSSERGFIDRALATPPAGWGKLRDLPPKAKVRAVHRRLNKRGTLTLRVDDDKSRHSRVAITFSTRAGKRISRAFRNVPTNRWVTFRIGQSLEGVPGPTSAHRARTRRRSSRTSRARPTSSGDGGASGREEAVAEPGLGHDQRGMPRILLDPPPQLRDLHAQVVGGGRVGVAPHLGHDRPVREQAPGMAEEAARAARTACASATRPRRARSRVCSARSRRMEPRSSALDSASAPAADSAWRSATRTRASSSRTENGLAT